MPCHYIVVGDDDAQNFGLAQRLRGLRGREFVSRLLEIGYVRPLIQKLCDQPLIVFLDLFGFDPKESIQLIGEIRNEYPRVVFCLFVDKTDFVTKIESVPPEWRARLQHYYKLYKEDETDAEFEPVVRSILRATEWEANFNVTENEPIRLTPLFERGLSEAVRNAESPNRPITFVSYARQDWDAFVSNLVTWLTREMHPVWVDQDYLQGGDDWMDAIGEALTKCERLLLVMSPYSIVSRYVKMEYRYFFKYEKKIIPIMYKEVDRVPFELAPLQFLDFTNSGFENSFTKLSRLLGKSPS